MGYIAINEHYREFNIDLSHALRSKLKLGDGPEMIEKDVALKALKSIERSSNIKAFVTNPRVILYTGFILLGLSAAVSIIAAGVIMTVALATALNVASLIADMFAGAFLTIGIGAACNCGGFKFLGVVSHAYDQQAGEAHAYIIQLEQDLDNRPVFLPEKRVFRFDIVV